MAKVYTEQSFPSTYKDDFADSDNYHRILFNSGRALQARELTQLQTIIQSEVARFGRNIFKEGAAVNPGGPTLNPNYEFIKLNTSVNTLPTDFTTIIGNEFTGSSSGVKVRVLEVVAEGDSSNPATLYVEYTGSGSTGENATPIRVSAGEDLFDGSETLTVQNTNTVADPCVGKGTQFSNAGGDFFVRGHFVFANPQSIIISKYTSNPTTVVGFTVTEDIVTVDDDDALYDNQGATPNRSSPGADRYRIKLNLVEEANASTDNFVFYSKVISGKIVEQVTGTDGFNKINDLLATRTKEESGNYIVRPFDIDFDTDSENAKLEFNVSAGNAYVEGYRSNRNSSYFGTITKPRDTSLITNEVVGIDYGNYMILSSLKGDLGVGTFAKVNLSESTTNPAASIIGTARVRYVEEDGANFRASLFNIVMNSGQVFRDVKTIGTSTTNVGVADLSQNGGQANLRETLKEGLVFKLPKSRPRTITDIDFEVQRIISDTSTGTTCTLDALTVTGETYVNTSQWIITRADGQVVTGATFSGSGTTSVTISGLPSNQNIKIYAKVNKAQPSIRTKQLIENATITGTLKNVAGTTFLNLGKADVKSITEIKVTNSSGRDITDEFSFDNGQRPNYYGPGRVVRNSSSSISGTIYVKFDYYQHNVGDVFAVNSYSGQVPYSEIPSLVKPSRDVTPLRDAIDFRPSTPDSGLDFSVSGAVINELPTSGDIFQGDVDYYLPRADKIVLKQSEGVDGEAQIIHIQGESGFTRPMPETPEGTLPLFELNLNAYGTNKDDLGLRILKYKRFTMQDINRIEEKLDNLKEHVSLSFLEVATDSMMVLDSSGIARTKSGIFADNFKNYDLTDTLDRSTSSGIVAAVGMMTCQTNKEGIDLVYNSSKSSNVVKKGDNIYLSYTHELAVKQNKISGTENVNPFAVVTGRGKITLSPASDWWLETRMAPDNIIHETAEAQDAGLGIDHLGEFERNVALQGGGGGTGGWFPNVGGEGGGGNNTFPAAQGNIWDNNWFLPETDVLEFGWFGIRINNPQSIRDEDAVFESQTTHPASGRRKQTTTFSKRTVVDHRVNTRVIGNRRIDLKFLPFMRSRKVFFKAEGLRPETRYFPYFSGKKVDDWVFAEDYAPSSDNANVYARKHKKATQHPEGATALVSNAQGRIEGSFFIPSSKDTLRFKAGTREFKLLDISINQDGAALSRAVANYTSQGQIETRIKDVLSTRTPLTQTQRWTEVKWIDPLAQSFRVPEGDGMYLTKVEAFFKTKDSKIPVECQIREMVNGHPSSDSYMASKFVNPNDVLLPTAQNQTKVLERPTPFEFDEPIYLKPSTEYCIVLLADCVSYNAYVGETYAFELGSTEKRINRQPSMGSLFKSQNGTTWEADQTKDMAFNIYSAVFSTAGGKVVLENGALPTEPLINNPFVSTASSDVLYCKFGSHGFHVGDIVTISGAVGGNGVAAGNINGNQTITGADGYGFTFETGDNASSSGNLGGNAVESTQQIEFDAVIPMITTATPPSTTMIPRAKFITGKSFAAVSGTQTRYNQVPDYNEPFNGDFELETLNRFNSPRLLATSANEVANLESTEKSITWEVSLDTTNSSVSPVVDMQRVGMGLSSNRIDKQPLDGIAANGYNVPYSFVAETNAGGGSSLSKHITRPVTLANDAVGMKVILSSLRPASASFDFYYRTANEGDVIFDNDWILGNEYQQGSVAPDERNFREYTYLIGGDNGDMDAFMQYQVKLVMNSTNTATPPLFKDLRVIALAT